MIKAIREQTGTPQNPVDWSDPDSWIPNRLSGTEVELAYAIWNGSKKSINPRHVTGSYLFINKYRLLIQAGRSNDQVSGSYAFASVLKEIANSDHISTTEMIKMLEEAELEAYIEDVISETEEDNSSF